MSEKELKALGFSPKKIKEIMADSAKNPMSQEEVLEDIQTQELEQQNKNEYLLKNIFIWSN
jgi:DNA-binding transcriptional MerR regulator